MTKEKQPPIEAILKREETPYGLEMKFSSVRSAIVSVGLVVIVVLVIVGSCLHEPKAHPEPSPEPWTGWATLFWIVIIVSAVALAGVLAYTIRSRTAGHSRERE